MKRTALVISGGGSRGAFAVGVLRRLFEQGVSFDVVAGTSTGALIGPLVAAQGSAALPRLVEEYTTVHDRDILQEYVPQEMVFRSPSLYRTDPLARRIGRGITPDIAETLVRSGDRQLFISTVNLVTGELVYFQTGPQLTPSRGTSRLIRSRQELMEAMLASATIPVIMPPVLIEGAPYVDGGVREYAPIDVTIDAGATDIYCVILAPESRNKGPKPGSYSTIPSVAMRSINLLMEECGDDDLRIADLYVRFGAHRQALRSRLAQLGVAADVIDQALATTAVPDPLGSRRAVTLHVIRPQRLLAGDTAKFDPQSMGENLAYGYQVAGEYQNWPGGVLPMYA
jgi:NTE family protein